MINLGAALAGGGGKRRDGDFYPTPWEATVALLQEVNLPEFIYEPACGDGAISEILKAYGHTVFSSDLVDRGYEDSLGEFDFLKVLQPHQPCQAIVTNPPFKLAAAFIDHALQLAPVLALLLKSQFWHAASRLPLFDKRRPDRVLPLTWRLDFTGGGNPTMDCTWFVWGIPGALFRPLPKPGPEMNPVFR